MIYLSVNVNKVALLRNTRDLGIPGVCEAARVSLEAGAHGITVHPRPDQRHIRPTDVDELAVLLKDYPGRELNIEGNPFEGEYMTIVRRTRPNQATLVPDAPGARTSDHGWRIPENADRLRPVIQELQDLGCRVSLFVDAEPVANIPAAADVGADRVELYTEPYARAFTTSDRDRVLGVFRTAAQQAHAVGLGVNAGHDLNQQNLTLFATVPYLAEVSIGHALTAEALLGPGLRQTVINYLKILSP